MGAELALAYIPLAKISQERLDELLRLVDSLEEDDIGECTSCECIEEWREEVRQAVLHLPQAEDCWREVWHLHCPDLPYALLFSGGLSWGDDPTESFAHFQRIMDCEQIWDRLVAWAKADAVEAGGSR